ncbi:hypothetical protein JMM81_22520 [Bacillus sp. V3B]|uniref:hypothetical protein n=1 Tax=Bacillus sp. V3B TaxID=2804915 RepID=UPI00210C746E|nr:hypothetical protein [Bacillus sp. V3B]MCQ6277617.1 hypothetical protein [Bacillus sp. V3B]
MLVDLFGSLLQGIPSKKNILINKKTKLLSQEDWYKEFVKKNGNLFIFNKAFRDFIYKEDIEIIIKDKIKLEAFQEQFKQVLVKEGFL